VSDHLGHMLVEGRRVKTHHKADPGHPNLSFTGTGSKASQRRRDFEFLQFNMHHSKGASFNLRRSLDRGQIDVAILQEPWVYKSRVRGLNSNQESIIVGTRAETPLLKKRN
jgi:hypothetical protein